MPNPQGPKIILSLSNVRFKCWVSVIKLHCRNTDCFDQDTLALLDVGDLIAIQKSITTSAGPTQFAQDLTIEGLEHRLTLSAGHSVTYFTSPTTIVYELILDDLVYGTLDEENVLG
jgi:hypothetical protein